MRVSWERALPVKCREKIDEVVLSILNTGYPRFEAKDFDINISKNLYDIIAYGCAEIDGHYNIYYIVKIDETKPFGLHNLKADTKPSGSVFMTIELEKRKPDNEKVGRF